jgi:hypothetical protein
MFVLYLHLVPVRAWLLMVYVIFYLQVREETAHFRSPRSAGITGGLQERTRAGVSQFFRCALCHLQG